MKIGGGSMDIKSAIVILQYLSNGMDPYTGLPLESEGPIMHPNEQEETIQAFHIAIRALKKMQAEERKKRTLPPNTKKEWSKEDIDLLLLEHSMGRPIEDIARLLERSTNSVRSKLFKLGEIVFEI